MTTASGSMPGRFIEDLTWPEAESWLARGAPLLVPGGAAAKEQGHHLPLKDDLLKYNRRDTEWKFEDLAAIVSAPGGLPEGRSYEVGRSLFQVANCVACHKLGDVGQLNIGPDLSKLDEKKLAPESILHIHRHSPISDNPQR